MVAAKTRLQPYDHFQNSVSHPPIGRCSRAESSPLKVGASDSAADALIICTSFRKSIKALPQTTLITSLVFCGFTELSIVHCCSLQQPSSSIYTTTASHSSPELQSLPRNRIDSSKHPPRIAYTTITAARKDASNSGLARSASSSTYDKISGKAIYTKYVMLWQTTQ